MIVIPDDVVAGTKLYGDDFEPEQIAEWFKSEMDGYYNMTVGAKDESCSNSGKYAAYNWFHGLRYVSRRHFRSCLAFGCADGTEIAPVAKSIDRIYAIEPAQNWWRSEINGTPTEYKMPDVSGKIDLADCSVDLIISLGVLHHIPNVSDVLREFIRVLEPGGTLVLREPISSMGDWRRPRPGLTLRERGIPIRWLDPKMNEIGFRYLRKRATMFKPMYILERLFKMRAPWDNIAIVAIDWMLAEMMKWNDHYWRTGVLDRVAPTSIFIIAQKQPKA
jgi:SAM-dependent methyltransferase